MPDELLVLGSACALPNAERFTTAYALTVADKLFLLDCGAPVSTLLYRFDLDPLDVSAIFLSHWHMDHISGLGLFLSQNHLLERPNSLSLYGPKGTRGKIKRLLRDSFLLFDELNYKLKVKNIKPGKKKYKAGLIRVTYFKTQHLEKSKYKIRFGGKAISCGMVINGPGWRIVYSGDLASSQELAPYLGGCDLLIHEMTHTRPEEVADFVTAAKVPAVLLSHIGPRYEEVPGKINRIFSQRYPGRFIIAEDGTRINLNRLGSTKKKRASQEGEEEGTNG